MAEQVSSNASAQQAQARQIRKAIGKRRHDRRLARNAAAPTNHRYAAELRLTHAQRAACLLRGIPEYLQQVVRMAYGPKGTWGHGLQPSGTTRARAFGRCRGEHDWVTISRCSSAIIRLARSWFASPIRGSGKESVFWRNAYAALTGKQYGG